MDEIKVKWNENRLADKPTDGLDAQKNNNKWESNNSSN